MKHHPLLLLASFASFALPLSAHDLLPDSALRHAAFQLELNIHDAAEARRQPAARAAQLVVARTEDAQGRLVLASPHDWCAGFLPGMLWMMYRATGLDHWRREAVGQTWLIQDAQWDRGTHDLGFMINNSFGKAYEATGERSYLDVLLQSARSLASRFNPRVGCIRSWDHNRQQWRFPVIIDNMMNLELLFRATQLTGDSTFWHIAVSHANTTLRHHFRPDHSSYHVVDYDPLSGAVRKRLTAQGHSDESVWSRGQAWGLYGFTMAYRFTRHEPYLLQARRIARFWLSQPHLPPDGIPFWDMRLPQPSPTTERDASAAAICASALYELAQYVPRREARRLLAYADRVTDHLFRSYRTSPGTHHGFLLLHSVGHKPAGSEIDVPLCYADYYYLEAILRRKARRTE